MGQYYRPVIGSVDTGDNADITFYDRSIEGTDEYVMAKLIEHSWWDSPTCNAVARIIYNNPQRVAWVGDYAEYDDIALHKATNLEFNPTVAWCINEQCLVKLPDPGNFTLDGKYFVNHDKGSYIDLNAYKTASTFHAYWCDEDMTMHPIPLMTAIGNGRGGGDYDDYNLNSDKVGSWTWDVIEVTDSPPSEYKVLDVCFRVCSR